MKAIILAGMAGVGYLGVMTLTLRLLPVKERALRLLQIWLVSVPLLGLAYWLTPPDLGFLPAELQDDPPWFGLVFCLGLWVAGFFGGLLQLYNLTERGLSLRLLIDVTEAGEAGLPVEEAMTGYSDGRGIAWMFGKRLDWLVAAGLVRVDGGRVTIAPSARRTARRITWLRGVLRLGEWT
ncbi:MAG: hypothetical protein AB7P40_30480 [Chloroflexota bacterium]